MKGIKKPTTKQMRPRGSKQPPVLLIQRKTKDGKRYLEAPSPREMGKRWVWSA